MEFTMDTTLNTDSVILLGIVLAIVVAFGFFLVALVRRSSGSIAAA